MILRHIVSLHLLLIISLASGCTDLTNGSFYKSSTPEKIVQTSGSNKTASPKPTIVSHSEPTPANTQTEEKRPSFRHIGSGKFVNSSINHQTSVSQNANGYALNFENIEIAELIGSVFGSTLNLNYTIDPAVKGKVTIRTGSPIPRSKLISHLEEVLLLHGVSLQQQNGLYKFVPASKALKGSPVSVTRSNPRANGFEIEIIPIKYIEAEEMAHILKPFSKSDAVISFDNRRRIVSISGSKFERDTLLDIIRIFDVNILSGMSFELVPLISTNPDTLQSELSSIFNDSSSAGLLTGTRFVPLSRLNSLLVIAQDPKQLSVARTWIKRLDIGKNADKVQLFVYKVQNTEAAEIAEVLGSLFESSVSSNSIRSSAIAPSLTPTTLSTSGKTPAPVPAILQQTANSNFIPSNTGTTNSPLSSVQTTWGEGQIKIVANKNTNSLFIKATARQYEEILTTLKQIDIVPLQVMIEATIAEVTLNNELKYGIEWFFQSGNSKATFSTSPSGNILSDFPGFSYFYGTSNVSAVINALDSVTDVNILSSPQLMVLDNHQALLQIGDQVPVATQSVIDNTTAGAPTVNTIEFRDTGIVLKVTPRVNSSGLVNLDIEQEVSDVVETTTSGIDSPTIQQRLIKSSVIVQSGETIALGGLIRDKVSDKQSGIPFLSQIPLIGPLFGATAELHSRTELLILITPRVVRNQREARELTDELRRKIHAFAPPKDK